MASSAARRGERAVTLNSSIGHAVRQRRYYRRHKRHRACAVNVEFGIDELNLLTKLKFLTDAQAHDRVKVGAAISKLITALAKKI
jgi:hypothetical protein